METHTRWRHGLAVLLAPWVLTAAAAAATPSPQIRAPSTAEWAALAKLPDWSGVWTPDYGDQVKQERSNPPPWNAAAAAKIARMQADDAAGHPHGIVTDCLPYGMPSLMLITHNAIEFLFTPGRITVLGEGDGNRLRRIYTDGRSHPEDPDPSFHGHSIGRWQGDTLVVDTVGILRRPTSRSAKRRVCATTATCTWSSASAWCGRKSCTSS